MLRTLFVLSIAGVGLAYSFRDPFFGLLFYLWIAYFRPESWVWSGFVATLPLSLIAGILLVVLSAISGTRFKMDVRRGLLFALLGHSLISTLLSSESAYAWTYWADFAKATIVTYLLTCLVTDASRFRMTILVIVASLGFEAAKQGFAQLLLNPGALNTNEHPILGDNNGVALGVLMLIPLLTALGQTAARQWERRSYAVVTVGLAYRAISTYSRGAFLATGALLGMYFLRSKRKARTAVAVIVVCAVIVPVLPQAFWDRMNTIAFSEENLEEDDASSRGRFHFWRVAVAMANANPVFGVGHNAFNPHYDRYDFLDGEYGTGRAVHSTWFGVLAELGYVGIVLFGANLLLGLQAAWRVRKAAARGAVSAELGLYAVAIESSLIVFIVGGTFLSFQYVEIVWHMIGLSIALRTLAEQPAAVTDSKEAAVPIISVPPAAPLPPRVPRLGDAARGQVRFTVVPYDAHTADRQ